MKRARGDCCFRFLFAFENSAPEPFSCQAEKVFVNERATLAGKNDRCTEVGAAEKLSHRATCL